MIKKILNVFISGALLLTLGQKMDAQCFSKIAAGHYHSFALTPDGKLFAWGEGYLGNTSWSNTPVQVGSDSDWEQISSGYHTTHAIKEDGTLWGWGANQYGELGDGTSYSRVLPIQITDHTDWAMISSGTNSNTFAIKNDGTLWGWGDNWSGQLGNGTAGAMTSIKFPVQIGSANDWLQVSGGSEFCLALKSNGTLWGWGENDHGQLGDGTSTPKLVPTQIGTALWSQISAGENYTTGIKQDGTIWAWGYNNFGNVGNGTTMTFPTPQIIDYGVWTKIKALHSHTMAIRSDGTLWAWGLNNHGQLGIGGNGAAFVPVIVGTNSDWTDITTGYHHTLALKSDGSLYAWGDNADYQIGNGMTIDVYTPLNITCPNLSTLAFDVSDLSVFPNPTEDILHFSEPFGNLKKAELFDFQGRLILSKNLDGVSDQISLSGLQNSIYVLKLSANGGAKTFNIVKK